MRVECIKCLLAFSEAGGRVVTVAIIILCLAKCISVHVSPRTPVPGVLLMTFLHAISLDHHHHHIQDSVGYYSQVWSEVV